MIALLLGSLVIMTIAASPASGAEQGGTSVSEVDLFVESLKTERRERIERNALESAQKLQRLAVRLLGKKKFREELEKNWWDEVTEERYHYGPPPERSLLGGRLRGSGDLKAAKEYIAAFPDSLESFHYLFNHGDLTTFSWVDGESPRLASHGINLDDPPLRNNILYIELFFDLFGYADKGSFIRRTANITIGAPFRSHEYGSSLSTYDRQLWHHFNTHVDDYIKYLSHDYLSHEKESVIALLRFFTLDQTIDPENDRFHHAWVNYGVGELCLSSVSAMKLCTAADLLEVPLIDDLVAALECGGRVDGDCAHADQGGTFQARLAEWSKDNARTLNAAFRQGSKEAKNYLPVFYMMYRYLADDLRELPLLEAKLYIHHPKLSMHWLNSNRGDFERAKGLGSKLLYSHACKQGKYRHALAMESKSLGKMLISRYKEYLSVGENLVSNNQFSIYKVDAALFTNRNDVKELLKHWERAEPRGRARSPYEFCKEQEQQRQQ